VLSWFIAFHPFKLPQFLSLSLTGTQLHSQMILTKNPNPYESKKCAIGPTRIRQAKSQARFPIA
jgi:hypothetical protein